MCFIDFPQVNNSTRSSTIKRETKSVADWNTSSREWKEEFLWFTRNVYLTNFLWNFPNNQVPGSSSKPSRYKKEYV